jgi:PIN domain nuclease of toxin-antitoxin system
MAKKKKFDKVKKIVKDPKDPWTNISIRQSIKEKIEKLKKKYGVSSYSEALRKIL